ncbi:MAG: hypothetical protein ACI9J5_002866 [Paraglaciecola sp.]
MKLAVDKVIKFSGGANLKIWIGNPKNETFFSDSMISDKDTIPALDYAIVKPSAQQFKITPS